MFLTRSPLSKAEISDLGRNFALLRVAINPFGAIAQSGGSKRWRKGYFALSSLKQNIAKISFFFNVVEEIMHVTLSKQRQGRCTTQKWTYMHQSCRGCSGEQHCMKFMPKIAQLSPPSTKHGGKGDFGAGPKLAAVPRPLRPHPCTLSSPSPSLWSRALQCWITHNVKKIHQVKDLLDNENPFQFNFCE